jgi:hypothetical protein
MYQWFHVGKETGTFINIVFVLNIASMGKVLLGVGDVIKCCGWIVNISYSLELLEVAYCLPFYVFAPLIMILTGRNVWRIFI